MSDANSPMGSGLAAADALRPGPGRPRRVGREAVVAAALDLLQREGLAAVTMRRVAEQVNAGIATVYAAAGSKQHILLAVVDDVLTGLPHVPENADPWDALHEVWAATHDLLMAYPAVAQLAALQPVPGQGVQRLIDVTLNLLKSAGLSEDAAWTGYLTLRSYTIGFTLLKISRGGADGYEVSEASAAPPEHHLEFGNGIDVLLRGLQPEI
ncbi:TetR/AcrR family transcriptional regulator [Mycobacterium avium]|uniref:TetR/AcrR family transcriptional regulator n=1 Tax=Mycobacterium avium TaxID=1764 RepID=UPI00148275BF|nr:TetR/AcrR family transcriptional regulator [Mycobacterium avium]